MCGINVFVDKKNKYDEGVILKMLASAIHRGPDHQGYSSHSFQGGKLYLGSNRLKISDPQDRSNQPFTIDGCSLIYNGEIYNTTEIQTENTNTTESDTEVLLNILKHSGSAGLTKINGMFAFAFYDKSKGEFLMARDRFGIKPLYFFENEEIFIASSETKGILSSGLVKKILNHEQIYHYLNFKYAQPGKTFFTDIQELKPGHYLKQTESGFTEYPFVDNGVSEPKNFSDQQILNKTNNLLAEAFQRQYPKHVDCGIFLSGGIDSTLLLSYAREGGYELPAFTISCISKDKSFANSEKKASENAATLFGQKHHLLEIGSDSLKMLPEFYSAMDQPVADSAAFLTYILSEKARGHVKVVMSGAGADEYFSGYNRHEAFLLYQKYFYQKDLRIKTGSYFSSLLPDGFDHPLRKRFRLYKKFLTNIDASPYKTFSNFMSMSGFRKIVEKELSHNPQTEKENLLLYALERDRKEYLPYDVLKVTDQFTMARSLEARVPFLDNDLITFAETLSTETLLKNGKKWILKDLLRHKSGEQIVNLPKEGFGLPIGSWIKEKKNFFLVDQILKKDNILYDYIDYPSIHKLLQAHLRSRADYSTELWALIVLSAWLEKEFPK
ncbi:MAG: asparagine synthase (glutamine-hydrolyzing) [Cytophagaceae bacterium]